jgi:dTMP kinase
MNQPTSPGFLLVVEGIDGAGKSTVLQQLIAHCRERGLRFVASKEPTDGKWGRRLRQSGETGRLSLEEEVELFLKDRAEHVVQLIEPALAAGKAVILDRYYLSTAAYQGARGADPEKILADNERFAPAPDLALLLDIAPAAGLSRVRRRGDVPDEFEREGALAEARRIFLSISRPWLVRIDAGCSPAEVTRQCLAEFDRAWDAKSHTQR